MPRPTLIKRGLINNAAQTVVRRAMTPPARAVEGTLRFKSKVAAIAA